MWIQSETRTWHDKNIQPGLIIPKLNEAFKVDKTYFKPERIFDRQPCFPKQIQKSGRDFQKFPEIKDKRAKQKNKKARN